MNKLLKQISLAILVLLTFQTISFAQETESNNQILIGAGLVFGSGALDDGGDLDNDLGLKVDGYYSINENLRAGASFTFYLPKTEDSFGGELTATVIEFDVNGQYIFLHQDDLTAYGLAGLNFTSVSVDFEGASDSESETGLNLGVGGEYALDFGKLFSELKLAGIGGDADQFVISAGLRIGL